MGSSAFWEYFDQQAAPRLAMRSETFRKMFRYLDELDRPVGIVETGCLRRQGNWEGDGQSTLLFDRYASSSPGSVVYAVDIDANATAVCKSLVSERVRVHTGDSVAFLSALVQDRPRDLPAIDLLYLDSFDLDLDNPSPSAAHHLKELLAVLPAISPQTLVVVDDSFSALMGYEQDGKFQYRVFRPIWGKGKLIAEYAAAVGVKPYFTGYQCAWIGLGREFKPSA